MEYAVWFMAALAMLATGIVVGAWKMINFKAALTCAVLMLISTLYFVQPNEYLPLVTWVTKVTLSHWVLLMALTAITAMFWFAYGTPAGIMTMVLMITAFVAIISGQAHTVMVVAMISVITVAFAWAVSCVSPAKWAAAGVWVKTNKLLFAGCLALVVLAIMLMLWVTGMSTLAKWIAFVVLVVTIVVFGQYAQAQHGLYTGIHRVWTTEIQPELQLWGVATEQFVRDASTNYIGPFLWEIKFAIAALVPARIAYWIYQNLGKEEPWATKTTLFLFLLGTLAFIGLQIPRAATLFFDLLGDLGVKIRNGYWRFFKTLPVFWQGLIAVGTVVNTFWCLTLLYKGVGGVGWICGVWWVILLPLCHLGPQINKMIKKWVT